MKARPKTLAKIPSMFGGGNFLMIYLNPSQTWEGRLDSAQPRMYLLWRDCINLRITEIDFNEWFEVVDDENKA